MTNLVKISVTTNYGTEIESTFLASDTEIENYKQLDGIEISFGEFEGKHSDVFGEFKADQMAVTELTEEEAKIIENHLGKYISDIFVFDYVDISELFFESFSLFEERIEQVALTKSLESQLRSQVVARISYIKDLSNVHYYHITNIVKDNIPLQSLKKWEEILDKEGTLSEEELKSFDNMVLNVLEQSVENQQGDKQ